MDPAAEDRAASRIGDREGVGGELGCVSLRSYDGLCRATREGLVVDDHPAVRSLEREVAGTADGAAVREPVEDRLLAISDCSGPVAVDLGSQRVARREQRRWSERIRDVPPFAESGGDGAASARVQLGTVGCEKSVNRRADEVHRRRA